MSLVVHGDDFTAPGSEANLKLCEGATARAFEIKLKGRLGPS